MFHRSLAPLIQAGSLQYICYADFCNTQSLTRTRRAAYPSHRLLQEYDSGQGHSASMPGLQQAGHGGSHLWALHDA